MIQLLTVLAFLVLVLGLRSIARALDQRRRDAAYDRAIWPERGR